MRKRTPVTTPGRLDYYLGEGVSGGGGVSYGPKGSCIHIQKNPDRV